MALSSTIWLYLKETKDLINPYFDRG